MHTKGRRDKEIGSGEGSTRNGEGGAGLREGRTSTAS